MVKARMGLWPRPTVVVSLKSYKIKFVHLFVEKNLHNQAKHYLNYIPGLE